MASLIHVVAATLTEIAAILGDPGTQWMVFICAGAYLVALAGLRRRLTGPGGGMAFEGGRYSREGSRTRTATGRTAQLLMEPALWLTALLVIASLAYGLRYSEAAKSSQALTLVGAAMIGQGAGLWESRQKRAEGRNVARGTVLALIILLAVAAVWQGENTLTFQYRGQARWSGPWDNPNTFGVMMGVGIILAVGRLVQSRRCKIKHQLSPNGMVGSLKARGHWLLMLAAAGVMGVGWVRSYSRGAWVGTVAGLAYLVYCWRNKPTHAGVRMSTGHRTWRWRGCPSRVAMGAVAGALVMFGLWYFL